MFAVYVPIFCNLRYRRKAVLKLHKDKGNSGCEAKSTVEAGKHERSLLIIQAVFVSDVMEVEFVYLNFLSKLFVKKLKFPSIFSSTAT
ncbi:hypothetical protein LOAG_13367 [Loa loa]|uniref:G_PROTEIN_RECEP_F1_2 domain-containing protein n=1 Tax=Loa loa TaxID=7209 RepID=A0A1S0TJL6_LOALO|nr:hypothetical protein LOAG_13367 [Loa loa]EFO15145.1 hypothetical protein LOAG_13367 [Loa loa]